MNQKYPKRLIEVDLPIRRISAHARREKSIRHGHISTLHIWWARRPLAACRAVICASLWPDPADPFCPQTYRDRATKIIFDFASAAVGSKELSESCDHETWIKWQAMAQKGALDSHNEAHWNILRFAMLDFIADFANWDNSTVTEYLETSRALTQAAHEALGGEPGTRPMVVDPFAGGGSIPLEALRVGADAFASDLNPIPVLLNKVVLEYIPKYGQRLADEVRKWGEWIKREAEKELSEFYPTDEDGATPIAYLWARTIQCEGPGCGATIPLLRSFWLAKKSNRSVGIQPLVNVAAKTIGFQIVAKDHGRWISQGNQNTEIKDPKFDGTVKRGSVTCLCCGYTTPVTNVREQLRNRRGGVNDAFLYCVVTTRTDAVGRHYRVATEDDRIDAERAAKALNDNRSDGTALPTQEFTGIEPRRIPLPQYGITGFRDLFLPRQALTVTTLVRKLHAAVPQIVGDTEFVNAVSTLLAFSVDRIIDQSTTLVLWASTIEVVKSTFGRQALPMAWDFVEAQPFAGAAADFSGAIEWVAKVCEHISSSNLSQGSASWASATKHPLADEIVDCVVTDPPYYYSVPYSDLSDFFYVWLRQMLAKVEPELFNEPLTPKALEIVQNLPHSEVAHLQKTRQFYEEHMKLAMSEASRITRFGGICVVVFAHTETKAWESMLAALVESGWMITGSWPIDTEREARTVAQRQRTLASSIHLACRLRKGINGSSRDDSIGDWRDVLAELPGRIHDWMPRLAAEGVVGADAIFACLGPALEVFSRYSRVEKANGDNVTLREYLEHVWAAVAREALTQVFKGADATGFEPDARLTAMWLWTLNAPIASDGAERSDEEDGADEEGESKPKIGGFRLEYDAARKIAQGLGAVLENLTHLVEVKGDEARLLPVTERTRYLFGKDQEEEARPARKKASAQMNMFAELIGAEDAETAWQEKTVTRMGDTTLDRVHQAMILFAAGRGDALKRFVVDDGVGHDGKFWRLAQALSALYPTGTDERRWVEGVMARKKQFGF